VEEHHRQYRETRKRWPIIPYDVVKRIKQLSPRLQIGDFGCGEANFWKLLETNEFTVLMMLQ